ncbi:sporulation integral membrane protein YlbJ [Natronincola ferrireducens]|uniref:Sporulation integral membrane protein YlbJ n=1 Tax=Natronincola ferrireducens TaxID=393762 RepID=A0A1G9BVW3_9FIRM|nr:sporulation integral membrane protein YlbJ [Natronincola ferrireducens]SDK43586.1 sporulation integral membrane protein YlbJ [Natronincola ferrireducens]
MQVIFIVAFLFLMFSLILFLCEKYKEKVRRYFFDYFIILIVVLLVICIMIFPNQSVKAAYDGLKIWFTVVLPALLPFFIGSELLVGLGVVKFIGTLLEPVMRPLFNVPGEGSFAFAMSITSGYPVGVKITTRLRKDNFISKAEAQRLVSFCSTSGPLFLIGAVSIGMFQSSEIGILLTICHYSAAIVVGFLFRFYKRSTSNNLTTFSTTKHNSLFRKAFYQLNSSRRKNPPFGILLGNAVKESINTMLMVGGFIVLFAVIINILNIIGFVELLSSSLYFILKPFHVDFAIIEALITGFLEITMGCKLAAETFSASLVNRIAAAGFIIGWSGFSIHAQSISIISTTDINSYLYIFAKLLHGIFSYILVYLLYPIFTTFFTITIPATSSHEALSLSKTIMDNLKISVEIFIVILVGLLFISVLVGIVLYIISLFKNKEKKLFF